MSAEPVCRWCYVMSRHRRNGPLGSLRVAFDCARSKHRHPLLQATLRNTGPKMETARNGSSRKVKVVLEVTSQGQMELPPLPTTVVDDLVLAAERILAEACG